MTDSTTTPESASLRTFRASTCQASSSNGGTSNSDTCPVCARLAYKNQKKSGTVWVECDNCETWYHWSCISPGSQDSLDVVDKWYCPTCIVASEETLEPLQITYKPSPRKSIRASRSLLDYANLHAHLPADVDRWSRVLATREIKDNAFKHYRGEDLTEEWIYREGSMGEPFIVDEPDNLGMRMPHKSLTISEIAEIIGPMTPIEVIDCASQSSLSHWKLSQWASYYDDPTRDKVRNVISLEVSGTPLADQIEAPLIVRKVDWVENIWPASKKEPGTYPKIQKYCLMSVARCWTDWHIDFAGSSVYYHVLRGAKVFYFIRPTPANLSAYEAWSGSADRQENTWLGDDVDEVYKVELTAGNTMIIPTGWIHAVYTPEDSLVFGGNFAHSLNIPTQLRVHEIEIATKVPRKFRFPFFVKLLWLVADHYTRRLRQLYEIYQGDPTSTAHEPDRTTLLTAPNKDTIIPQDIHRSSEGLKILSAFLIGQAARFDKKSKASTERKRIARENVPWEEVKDPAALARDFRALILRCRGEPSDLEAFVSKEEKIVDSTAVGSPTAQPMARPKSTEKESKLKKRKADTDLSGNKTKSKTNGVAPEKQKSQVKPPNVKSMGDATIISRNVSTAKPVVSREYRSDPTLPLNQKPKEAEITCVENTNEVVRRLVEDDGSITLETRTVFTKIERVKWSLQSQEKPDSVVSPAHQLMSATPENEIEQIEIETREIKPTENIAVSPEPLPNTVTSYESQLPLDVKMESRDCVETVSLQEQPVKPTGEAPMYIDFDLLAAIGATIAQTENNTDVSENKKE